MSPFNLPRPIWKLEHPSLFVKEDFSYLLATQRRVAVKLDELWDMFLKSRSQLNTSGKLQRCTGLRSIRTGRLVVYQIAKFLALSRNGSLLPSSLHSKRYLRSTGNGAPLTRTTGALFRRKDWAFGPFPCFSSCFPFCLFSCCLVKQDLARSLRSLALADSSNMPIPIYWHGYNDNIHTHAADTMVCQHRFDSCGVLYCLVKGDFKNPIFMIIVNIWPNGAIGYHGASS